VSRLGAAALDYAAAGWPVFPCRRYGKPPLTDTGFKEATTDPDVIRAWWQKWPFANVAVATGAPGPDVLDVDTKDSRPGMELFDRVRVAGLLVGAAAIIRTPSGGLHVWFEGTEQGCGAVGGRSKPLELKARGGYVLLPPSHVISTEYGYNGVYELIESRETAGFIDFRAVRDLLDPAPITRAPRPGGRRQRRDPGVTALAAWLAGQGDGNRNNATYWAACRALDTGHDDLEELVSAAVTCGLSDLEARRTVESARRRIRGAA
jgi:hypothetical protein